MQVRSIKLVQVDIVVLVNDLFLDDLSGKGLSIDKLESIVGGGKLTVSKSENEILVLSGETKIRLVLNKGRIQLVQEGLQKIEDELVSEKIFALISLNPDFFMEKQKVFGLNFVQILDVSESGSMSSVLSVKEKFETTEGTLEQIGFDLKFKNPDVDGSRSYKLAPIANLENQYMLLQNSHFEGKLPAQSDLHDLITSELPHSKSLIEQI